VDDLAKARREGTGLLGEADVTTGERRGHDVEALR